MAHAQCELFFADNSPRIIIFYISQWTLIEITRRRGTEAERVLFSIPLGVLFFCYIRVIYAFAYYIEINTSLIVVIFRSVHVSLSSREVAHPPSAKKRHNGMKTVRVVLNPAYEGGGNVKMTLVRMKTLPFFFRKDIRCPFPRLSCHRSDELLSLRGYDIVGYE